MGHSIEVFIAKTETLEIASRNLSYAHVIPLSQGLAMLPNADELYDEITNYQKSEMPPEFEVFSKISASLISWAEQSSTAGPIVYIETEYFGGTGSQSAVVWDEGRLVLGASKSETKWSDNQIVQDPLAEQAVNRALRYLGVRKADAIDEFAAIGLDKFRSNIDWINQPDHLGGGT